MLMLLQTAVMETDVGSVMMCQCVWLWLPVPTQRGAAIDVTAKKKASRWIHYRKFPYTFCSQVGGGESAARRCLKSRETRCALMTVCLLPLLHSLHLRWISAMSDYQTEKGGWISNSEHALFGTHLLACMCHASKGHAPVCQKELNLKCSAAVLTEVCGFQLHQKDCSTVY